MVCQFLLYNNVNQPYVYIYPLPLGLPSKHPPLLMGPPSHPCRSPQDAELNSFALQQVPSSQLFHMW